jgi:hypothetical protein
MKDWARAMAAGASVAVLLLLMIAVGVWLVGVTGSRFEAVFAAVIVVIAVAAITGYFTSSSTSILGFFIRLKQEKKALFPPPVNETDVMRDTRWTRDTFLSIAYLGVFAIFIYALQWKPDGFVAIFGGGLMIAIAALTVGVCLGFLFGIPRTLQGNAAPPPPTPPGAGAAAAPHLGVNTNLEQISDWLTKIIIGLGLINLEKFPAKVRSLITQIAPTVGGQYGFALAIVLGFSICGFMVGYLLTRLYLAGAFVRAEQNQIDRTLDSVGAEAARKPIATGSGDDPVSTDQRVAAARVERLAQKLDGEDLRAQVQALAREYESVRASMQAGDARTRQMEIVASKMRALSLACYELLPVLTQSPSAGERLAAISFLEVKPSMDYATWLADRITQEMPFVMYHAAWALRHAVRVLPKEQLTRLSKEIARALGAANAATQKDQGTIHTLEAASDEVQKRLSES